MTYHTCPECGAGAAPVLTTPFFIEYRCRSGRRHAFKLDSDGQPYRENPGAPVHPAEGFDPEAEEDTFGAEIEGDSDE